MARVYQHKPYPRDLISATSINALVEACSEFSLLCYKNLLPRSSEHVTGFLPQILRRSQGKIWSRVPRVRVQARW